MGGERTFMQKTKDGKYFHYNVPSSEQGGNYQDKMSSLKMVPSFSSEKL